MDDYDIPPKPAETFDRIRKQRDDPPDVVLPEPAAYFGCFDCLDEIAEEYSIGCPDW